MKFELTLLIITGAVITNIYYDGKFFKKLNDYKKYYKMASICFVSLCFYLVIKKDPKQSQQLMQHGSNYIKFLPIDKQSADLITPFLKMNTMQYRTNRNEDKILRSGKLNPNENNYPHSYQSFQQNTHHQNTHQQNTRQQNTHQQNTHQQQKKMKRSVSETKKKWVASNQNWNCGHCNNQLNAWFEVDHILSLEDGGSNHVNNLVALCRECHGKKTTMSNL
tara:strand:+ start:2685 stop:3347 length:663 start_codon:yes stop_codon:yes gene_type:complete